MLFIENELGFFGVLSSSSRQLGASHWQHAGGTALSLLAHMTAGHMRVCFHLFVWMQALRIKECSACVLRKLNMVFIVRREQASMLCTETASVSHAGLL